MTRLLPATLLLAACGNSPTAGAHDGPQGNWAGSVDLAAATILNLIVPHSFEIELLPDLSGTGTVTSHGETTAVTVTGRIEGDSLRFSLRGSGPIYHFDVVLNGSTLNGRVHGTPTPPVDGLVSTAAFRSAPVALTLKARP
jgi:hypothetical protein